jgi:DNA helicase HerA-like ATPase
MTNGQAFPDKFFGVNGNGALDLQELGVVVGGSLTEGIQVKLNRNTVVEGVAVGSYVTIKGQTNRKFFGLVTDIRLDASDPSVSKMPPADDEFINKVYRGTAVFGVIDVKPMLVEDERGEVKPVKTVPAHFTHAYRATPEEVEHIFQVKDKPVHRIGEDIETGKIQINLNLQRLIERSSAVFGRSGTGKTFLTVPLLASVIKNTDASVLVFDMHNDYGYSLKADGDQKLPSLKRFTAISNRVVVVSLDEESSKRRQAAYEFGFKISYDQIEPEDLEQLKEVLSFSDVQVNALFALRGKFKKQWIHKLLAEENDAETEEWIEGGNIVKGTFTAMRRKLQRLLKFDFVQEETAVDFTQRVLEHLTNGTSVVVEFGRYGNDLPAYVFVANFLTRRIHQRYVDLKEAAEGSGGKGPKQLVIAIEEAHKFLEPGIADLTIFGTIARELRKYNVTLLIVDQRPSQIDAEIMSQIGTRITCALSDEKDISAVFAGVSGAHELRSVLSSLDSKQQALIMGHAVPMPVVVKTSTYDDIIKKFIDPMAELPAPERKAANAKKMGRYENNPDDLV